MSLSILPTGIIASADSVRTDGVYNYILDNGGAIIDSINAVLVDEVNIPSKLGGYNVIGIGGKVFYQQEKLREISIPDGVKSIGESAFYGCDRLESVDIPDTVTKIGESAFAWCTSLYEVTIPANVSKIGALAFQGCSNLVTVNYKAANCNTMGVAYDDYDFITVFDGCEELTTINVANGVEIIPDYAFANISELEDVKFGNDIKTIGENAFYNCGDIEEIVLPEGLEIIRDGAFSHCGNLESITLPKSVERIGKGAFNDCAKIEKVSYSGTESQKEDIAILEDNDSLKAAKWNFTNSSEKHSYEDYVCSICGKWDTSSLTSTETINKREYCVISNDAAIQTGPYGKCKTVKRPAKGTIIKVTQRVYNAWGNKWFKCSEGYIYSKDVKKHESCTWGSAKVTKKATTDKNGKKVKKCTVCGKVKEYTIKKIKSVKLSTTSYTYSGKSKKPSVTVKDSSGDKLKKNTDYTVSYSKGREKVGTYKVTVKFKGEYKGSKTLKFKINPRETKIEKIKAYSTKLKIKISKKKSQTSGYQIQGSSSKKFTNARTITLKGYKKVMYTFSGLKSGKTYYVRVRTYKTVDGKKYYSDWSSYKAKKTK